MRLIFLTVVPIALMVYPPGLWILGHHLDAGCGLLARPPWPNLLLAGQAWQLGLRRYASTGS